MMTRRLLARVFAVLLLSLPLPKIARASDSSHSFEVETVPRIEIWQGDRAVMQEIYGRLAIDGTRQTGDLALRARSEGFATYDFAEQDRKPIGNPDLRNSRNEADLTELWADATYGTLGIRVGRQPIRWSQSWTLPSLDILTGRRFNRLFMDPLIDQLIHPDAVRITKSLSLGERTVEVEGVRILRSAQDRVDHGVTAVKASTRFGSLDIGFVLSGTQRGPTAGDLVGTFGSYAFEKFVAKFEAAYTSPNSQFAMIGADWFVDNWMIGPQVTVFRNSLLGAGDGTALFFLPIRYSKEKNTFEFDWLQNFGDPQALRNRFAALRFGREIAEALVLSIGIQDYRGSAIGMLGQSETLTGGQVYGMRLEYTGGWVK